MASFYLTYKFSSSQPVFAKASEVSQQADLGEWSVLRNTLQKFQNHKFFLNEPSFFFSTDGVILNRDELLTQYCCSNFAELVLNLYHQYGETFFRHFRGSFSGVFYDKEKKLMLVFTDQTGSHLLFWKQMDECILISSDVYWVIAQTHEHRWDQLGLYELLTYGYMPSHHSIIEGIQRLPAGCYLRVTASSCESVIYHRFANTSIHQSAEEEVQGVDRLFRQAVQRVLKVNAEYDYRNIFPLSAGLDSRMVTWVAHCLTEKPIANYTHGLPEDQDVIVAQSIAERLSHEWSFHSQESAQFYANIDHSVRHSNAQICYAGIAEATDVFSPVLAHQTGIILTGIGGDDTLTSPLARTERHYHYGECALSSARYSEQKALIPNEFTSLYDTRNIFYIYARTFECHAMGSPLAFQQFTESYSPFTDVDFLEFVLSIPERHRKNYRLYDRWVLNCYPEAAQWKHNGKTVGKRTPELFIFHRHLPLGTITKHVVSYVLKKLHICDLYSSALRYDFTSHAAPIWQRYFETNKHYLQECGKIGQRIEEQFTGGNDQEKLQALTVLSAIKLVTDTIQSDKTDRES